MPAASYVSAAIERSLPFGKNSSSVHGCMGSKLANVDQTAFSILSTRLDFIKYDKPPVKYDIKTKYQTLSSNDLNANISSICSTYSKTAKLSLNNVSSSVSNDRKSMSSKDVSSNSGKCLLPKPKEVLYSPSKIVLGWQGRVPVGAGLVNAINTCYLNSCLQALFHIPSFHNWLLKDSEHQQLCENQNGSHYECLVCAMRKTLTHCQAKSGGAIRPELIIKKLKLIARHLEHHRQEDSHEFLTYLIEGMQKSYLKAIPGANKLDSFSKETTPLYQLFGTYLRTEVTCNVCSHVSTSYTHSTELSLDIRQASSLDEALNHFFAKETLGGDNLYKCEQCGRSVEATKRFRLESPPNVLRLQLKRFNYHGFKNSRSVLVPLQLDFGKFMHPPHLSLRPSAPGLKYKLVSAVIHHGSSPDSGHYTCIGSTSSGTYHYFDDEMVRGSNLHQLTNAYVVMYELLPSSAATLHGSSSPGMASPSCSSPRKLIGPLLPPQSTQSAAVNSNINISSLHSATSIVTNGASKLVNGAFAGSKLVNGSSPTKPAGGLIKSPLGGGLASSKLLNGLSKGPAVLPAKLPSPAFLKNGTSNGGDGRKSNGLANGSVVAEGNSSESRRSMPELSGSVQVSGDSCATKQPLSNGVSTGAADGSQEKATGGAVSSGARSESSDAQGHKATSVTNGRDSPSANRNGLKRAKLVDYESDDEGESNPDDGPHCDKKWKKSKSSPAPGAASRNGWRVLGTEAEAGAHEVGTRGEVKVTAGMEWSVVPVTPPAHKTSSSPLEAAGPTPTGSVSSACSSPSSVCSSRSTSHYFASKLSGVGTGVSEYLSRRNMSGESSYGSNNVTSWSNEPSSLVQNANNQPQSRFPRYNGGGGDREEDEEDMDRGRVKKVKSQQHNGKYPNNNYYNKPGHNPFSHYQQQNNNNRKSYYNSNSGNDKYHYNKYPHYNNKHRHPYRHQPYHRRY